MKDNFNFRDYLKDNRLGAYAKNEAAKKSKQQLNEIGGYVDLQPVREEEDPLDYDTDDESTHNTSSDPFDSGENLNQDSRLDDLVGEEDVDNFEITVRNMLEVLLNDGFQVQDVQDFLHSRIQVVIDSLEDRYNV